MNEGSVAFGVPPVFEGNLAVSQSEGPDRRGIFHHLDPL
jgi:hypothetical protein